MRSELQLSAYWSRQTCVVSNDELLLMLESSPTQHSAASLLAGFPEHTLATSTLSAFSLLACVVMMCLEDAGLMCASLLGGKALGLHAVGAKASQSD